MVDTKMFRSSAGTLIRTPKKIMNAFGRGKLIGAALLAIALLLAPRSPSQVPSGKDVVAPTVVVSLDPAGRGSTAQIAVLMKIRPGFHVNAREKSAEYLIATDLKPLLPAGFTSGEVSYPKGTLQTFTFSKTPLNVYEGTVKLLLPLTIGSSAPLGTQHLPLKLKYQACSTEVCLPPVTLNLDAAVNVAATASDSKASHQDVFAKQK